NYPNGRLVHHLPIELVKWVISQMSIADMVSYTGTPRANYIIMHEAISSCFRQVVAMFSLEVNTFLEIIFAHHAVISGSLALYLFDPWHR
ncbi:hypothetical protein PAXINDRAFT_80812, partial [Paxillus involutus ATCC 200175]